MGIGQIKMLVFIPYLHFIRLFSFWLCHVVVCSILVPQPGIEPRPPVVEAQSPNHWTSREFHPLHSLDDGVKEREETWS